MHLCNETITVLNSYTDASTKLKVYLPTTLVGVSWFSKAVVDINDKGLSANSVYTLRIPANVETTKTYVAPLEFERASDKSTYWTLADGDKIIKGAVSGELKPSDLEDMSDYVCTVVSVTDNRRVKNAPHWKVVGK